MSEGQRYGADALAASTVSTGGGSPAGDATGSPVPAPTLSASEPTVSRRATSRVRSASPSWAADSTTPTPFQPSGTHSEAAVTEIAAAGGLTIRASMSLAAGQHTSGRLGDADIEISTAVPDDICVTNRNRALDSSSPEEIYQRQTFLFPTIPGDMSALVLRFVENWGNPHYVGLSGVELFDGSGRRLVPTGVYSSFDDPQTASQVPGATSAALLRETAILGAPLLSNPMTVIDAAHLRTTDARRMCRLPTSIHPALIWFTFSEKVDLSLVRVYNYNCGREHVAKGVRWLEMTDQDERLLFAGEIRQGTGDIREDSYEPETILFADATRDTAVLANILQEDEDLQTQQRASDPFAPAVGQVEDDEVTANGSVTPSPAASPSESAAAVPLSLVTPERPAAVPSGPSTRLSAGGGSSRSRRTPQGGASSPQEHTTKSVSFAIDLSPASPGDAKRSYFSDTKAHSATQYPDTCPKDVAAVALVVHSTWGDPHFVGLSGLRFYSPAGEAIYNVSAITIARPPAPLTGLDEADIAALTQYDSEVSSLVDGNPATACVWQFQERMQVRVFFSPPVPELGFVEVANYSIGSATQCGVKRLHIAIVAATGGSPRGTREAAAAGLDALWTSSAANLPSSVSLMTSVDAPVILRKAPSQLRKPRFQSFDLSLCSSSASGDSGRGAGGGASLTTSMAASTTVRLQTELRRARLMLLPRGDDPQVAAFIASIPHPFAALAETILPIAYVFKVHVTVCTTISPQQQHNDLHRTLKTALKSFVGGALGLTAATSEPPLQTTQLMDVDGRPLSREEYSPAVVVAPEASTASSRMITGPESTPAPTTGSSILTNVSVALNHQQPGLLSSALQQQPADVLDLGAFESDEKQATSTEAIRICTDVSFLFVLDCPTALSAIQLSPTSVSAADQSFQTKVIQISIFADDSLIYEYVPPQTRQSAESAAPSWIFFTPDTAAIQRMTTKYQK